MNKKMKAKSKIKKKKIQMKNCAKYELKCASKGAQTLCLESWSEATSHKVTEQTGLPITIISAVKHKHLKGNIFYQHLSWLLASITRSYLRGWWNKDWEVLWAWNKDLLVKQRTLTEQRRAYPNEMCNSCTKMLATASCFTAKNVRCMHLVVLRKETDHIQCFMLVLLDLEKW